MLIHTNINQDNTGGNNASDLGEKRVRKKKNH